MSNNIDFKDLWAKQKTVAPNPEIVKSEFNKMKKINLRKLIATNLLLFATAAGIILIWIYFQPQFLSTKLGIIITILAMVLFLLAYNKSYALYKNDEKSQSNSDYLKTLLTIKAKQQFMETTMLNGYFILLSLGIGLYMYEYAIRMKPLWGIVTYAVTAIWILFNWVYLRPKQIKKQQAKLNTIIEKFEKLNKQIKD